MGARRRTRRPSRQPAADGRLAVDGAVLIALAGVVPLVYWSSTATRVVAPKVLAIAVLVVVAVAARGFARRRTAPPRLVTGPAVTAVAAFVVLATIATLTSDALTLSFLGHHERYSGLLLYLAGAVLFLLAATVEDRRWPLRLALSVGIGAALVGTIALVRFAGGGLSADLSATLGNRNFVAAHGAMGAGIGVALAAGVRRSAVRLTAVSVALASGLAVLAGMSLQGYVAGAAAVAVALAAAAVRRWPTRRTTIVGAVGGGGMLGMGMLIAGGAGAGPLSFVADRVSTQYRLWNWEAALAMAGDRPFTGVGMDRYGAYVHAYRPAGAAEVLGPEVAQGAAHNVPLHLLATGGVPLALTYLAVVVITAWALVRGLSRLAGRDHVVLGALGAGWVGYQVQSLVSIDMPSLLVTHWLLAGAIIAVATPPTRRAVPDAIATRWSKLRLPATTAATLALTVLLVVPAGALFIGDRAAGLSGQALQAGAMAEATERAERATEVAAWEPAYWDQLAVAHLSAEDHAAALTAFEGALDADPRNLPARLNAARLAAVLDQRETAAAHYQVVLELEPNNDELRQEADQATSSGS